MAVPGRCDAPCFVRPLSPLSVAMRGDELRAQSPEKARAGVRGPKDGTENPKRKRGDLLRLERV